MLDIVAIPLLLVAVGAVRVVPQLIGGGTWGSESTVAATMVLLGAGALVGELRACRDHRPRHVVARATARIADDGHAR